MKQRTPVQVAADVGLRVRELRRAAGLTQQALADGLKMTVQYLRRIESSRVNLSVESLVRVARALGVEPAALLEPPADRAKPKRGRPQRVDPPPPAKKRLRTHRRRTGG